LNVVFVYADSALEWNTSEWRCLAFADAMNKAAAERKENWFAKLIHVSGFEHYMSPDVQRWVNDADIVIFQRNLLSDQMIDGVRYWQGRGKPIVVDLDDAYQMLPSSNPAHNFWHRNSAKLPVLPLDMLCRGLSVSDGLISPNKLLLADWKYITNGYYVPNYARREWWQEMPDKIARKTELGLSDRILIGWGGSVSHYDSWWGSGLRDAATIISRNHPEVIWVICGNDPRIFEQLPVPIDQKRMQPGVSPNEWPKVVGMFDIGVAPLYGPYDQRRSWIKGLEYGLAGIPWIGSYGEPYEEFSKFGKLVRDGTDNWAKAIMDTLDNLVSENELATRGVPYFQSLFIDNQLDYVKSVYSQIINDFRADHGVLPGLYFINWDAKPTVKAGEPTEMIESDKPVEVNEHE
jgi:hypothetical protein